MIAHEIVRMQKQEYAAAGLITDAARLRFVRCFCQQNRRAVPCRRRNDNPTLVGTEFRVFDQMKSQRVRVEVDRFVVVPYDDGNVCEPSIAFICCHRMPPLKTMASS